MDGHSFIVLLFYVIKGSIFYVISQVFKFVRMLQNLYNKSFFIILDIVSLIIFYIQIFIWVEIIRWGNFWRDEFTQRPINVI